MGRKPLPLSQRKKQFNLLMDEEMRTRLEKLAAERGQTVGEVIRAELVYSLNLRDQFDWQTQRLGQEIMSLADRVKQQGSKGLAWHEHPKALEALTEAILTWLEGRAPSEADPDLFGRDDPKTLGRAIARGRAQEDQRFGRWSKQLGEVHEIIGRVLERSKARTEKKKKGKPKS
jgi:hypothetical protein